MRVLYIFFYKLLGRAELIFFRKYKDVFLLNPPNFITRFKCFVKIFFYFFFTRHLGLKYVIGLVTARADKRMLEPLSEGHSKSFSFLCFFSKNDPELLSDNSFGPGAKKYISAYPLLVAAMNPKKSVLITCLDHQYYKNEHSEGIKIVSLLKKFGVVSFCLQHGGVKSGNILGQSTSLSDYYLLWGNLIYTILHDQYNIPETKMYVTGNPLHDRLAAGLKENYLPGGLLKEDTRCTILLATCLHSEYERMGLSKELYNSFMEVIAGIDFSRFRLLIKTHPYDQVEDYRRSFSPDIKEGSDFIIFKDSSGVNVYDLIRSSHIIITRASTVAEEAAMLGKKVVLFDVTDNSPSSEYDNLLQVQGVKKIITTSNTRFNEFLTDLKNNEDIENIKQDDLVQLFTFSLDGKSSDRIREVLASHLNR